MKIIAAVSMVALFGAVCGLLLKRSNGDIALLFSLGVTVVIFLYLLPEASMAMESAKILVETEELSEVIGIVVKALGVAIAARVAVLMCKDAGENALAAGVEFASKTALLLLIMPLFTQFMDLLREILKL